MLTRATYLAAAALAAIALTLSAFAQRPQPFEDGLGWDGAQYVRLASQCWREPMQALEPFVYRIGAPCLAALLPLPPKTALMAINIASGVLLLFLLAEWLRQFVAPAYVPWLLAGFAFHWLTPLRYSWWYPTYIDPPALCAIVGALLLRKRPVWLAVVCAIGTLIRETVIVVPMALAIGRLITMRRGGTLAWRAVAADAPLGAGALATLAALIAGAVTHIVVTPGSDYWMADAAFYWAFTKPLPSYLLAWCVAFGPAIILPLLSHREVRRFLADAPEHAVLLAVVAVLAWVGGSDTERILLWGAPVVLALIGIAAGAIDWRRSRGPLALLCAAQVISGRWFWTTPTGTEHARAWPVLTPLGATHFEDLLSQSPDRVVIAIALIQYLALALLLAIWLRRRQG